MTWHRERKARAGKENLPEIKEIFDHYRTVSQMRTRTQGWIDYPVDGAQLRRMFEREERDERAVLVWLVKEFIDQHFVANREMSKLRLSYILWKYQEESKERSKPPTWRRFACA